MRMPELRNSPLSHSLPYNDIKELKEFYQIHPLHHCFPQGIFSPDNTYQFFSQLAYDSEDMGRCISLILNVITMTVIQNYGKEKYGHYLDAMINGQYVTAICNNEAFSHGSNLNVMKSFIKYNDDKTHDISIDKKVITNVGASDLLFVNLTVSEKQNTKFVIVIFEGHEIPQYSVSNDLAGLASCPSGGIKVELKNCKNIKILAEGNKSLLVMRQMYNMERFLIGCVVSGILKKIVYYALQETDADLIEKFNNQYLQDKVIDIFNYHVKLTSLIKQCIHLMNNDSIIEPILSLIKLSCIDDVRDAIMKLKEINGAKSYFKYHITTKLLRDHEAIYNLGGTKELMKQTLFNDLKSKKVRSVYV